MFTAVGADTSASEAVYSRAFPMKVRDGLCQAAVLHTDDGRRIVNSLHSHPVIIELWDLGLQPAKGCTHYGLCVVNV